MILTTNEFLTKIVSVKLGKSCKIKKTSNKNLTIAIMQPKIIFMRPVSLGIYSPVKKLTNDKPAQAKSPRKTL